MKKVDKSSCAGTEKDSSTNVEVEQVSQPIAKPNVVGSLFGIREVKFRFWLGHIGKMTYSHSLSEVCKIIPDFTEDIIPLQYTGLKDKNGKEIYEGDILKSNYSLPLVVVFSDGKFCFYNSQSSGSDVLSQMRVEKLDVIGNIFENPELLQTLR